MNRSQTYAVMILQELGRSRRPLSLVDLARAVGISVEHVRQIMQPLVKARLVQSKKGPGGGYSKGARRPTVLQVVRALPVSPDEGQGLSERARAIQERVGRELEARALGKLRVDAV